MDQHQLELLWQYQQEDMKADRLEHEIKHSPVRQKMEKDRNLFMDKQKQHKQIEEQVAVLADRSDAIRDAVTRSGEQLKVLNERFENCPPETAEEIAALLKEAEKCRNAISDYEKEMKKIAKEAEGYEVKQRTIRHEAAKLKAEFEALKEDYVKESAQKKEALDAQRAVAESKLADVPAELLSEYNAIKRHTTPPVAKLFGTQCSGCNTAQPSAQLRKIKAGNEIVECETCGRMIIQ